MGRMHRGSAAGRTLDIGRVARGVDPRWCTANWIDEGRNMAFFGSVLVYRWHKVRYAILGTLPDCADNRLAVLGLLASGDKMKWTDPIPWT